MQQCIGAKISSWQRSVHEKTDIYVLKYVLGWTYTIFVHLDKFEADSTMAEQLRDARKRVLQILYHKNCLIMYLTIGIWKKKVFAVTIQEKICSESIKS